MSGELLNEFKFPEAALANGAANFLSGDFTKKTVSQSPTGTVNDYQMSGHDKGVAFRFFVAPVRNEVKSEEFDMEINDEIEMIEWNVSKGHRPTERVTMVGDALLKFAKTKTIGPDGRPKMVLRQPLECTGGAFKEAYLLFREGKSSPGLPLGRWEKCSLAQVSSFASIGIFSVQQLAAMPRDRVEGRLPSDLVSLFNQAIQWVNAQSPMENVQKYADQILDLKQAMSKKDAEFELLKSQMEALLTRERTEPVIEKKKRGRPKRVVAEVVESEVEEMEGEENGN